MAFNKNKWNSITNLKVVGSNFIEEDVPIHLPLYRSIDFSMFIEEFISRHKTSLKSTFSPTLSISKEVYQLEEDIYILLK